MAKGKGLGRGIDALISGSYAAEIKKTQPAKPAAAPAETDPAKAAEVSKEAKRTKTAKTAKGAPAASVPSAPLPAAGEDSIRQIRLSQIDPNRSQPRESFDEEALQELAASIREHGVLQPVLVRPAGKRYEIIAGERRWRAAKLAKCREIPVIVREMDDAEAMQIALIENIQREDLNPIEEAAAYQRLMEEYHLTQEETAAKVGKSRAAVANSVRLLKLDPEVRGLLTEKALTEGHARALLTLEVPELQRQAAQEVVSRGLTVRETEKLVRRYLEPPRPAEEEDGHDAEAQRLIYAELEDELRAVTGTRVEIRRGPKERGKILLDYYSLEELERLLELFRRMKD